MSECRRTVEQLAPYVDGILTPAERDDVARHLDACPPCRQAATEVEGGREVLRGRSSTLARSPLPPGLRTRCEALARETLAARGPWWRRQLMPSLAVAGMLVATVLILFVMITQRSNVLLAQQLTADHVKCFMFSPAPRPASAGSEESAAAFVRSHGWNVHIPPSSPTAGVTLIGVRRCLYASGVIPHVMYREGDQHLSLFVLDGVSRSKSDLITFGHDAHIWSHESRTYVLVSDHADRGLSRGAAYLMDQVR